MKRFALIALLLVFATVLVTGYRSMSRSDHSWLRVSQRSETSRIQAHLASAERVLSMRDMRSLTPRQKRARLEQIANLRAYRERGVFPHNHDFPGSRRPYFVDRHGVLCAMAHLISTSGRDDIVRAVAASQNNARVYELAADPVIGPVLMAWLDGAGLTVEEAQRIQPEYGGEVVLDDEESTSYAVASGVVGAINIISTVVNASGRKASKSPSWAAYTGLVGGFVGMGLGGAKVLDTEGQDQVVLGLANLSVGTVSAIAAITAIAGGRRDHRRAESSSASAVQLAAGCSNGARPYLGIRARF